MNRIKIVTGVFYLMLVISLVVLLKVCVDLTHLVENASNDEAFLQQYSLLQKDAGMHSIIAFVLLLGVGFLLFYLTTKSTPIILSNIVYIAIILYVFITTNRVFYENQNIEYTQQSEYWLTIFMGIFYILGAILVSVIGYITVRNYLRRSQHAISKVQTKIE
jgi:hypothetical protein